MHHKSLWIFLATATAVAAFSFTEVVPDTENPDQKLEIASNAAAINIADDPFTVMMQVIAHKRCVNCHPSGDQPRQGEDSHLHNFNVQRGPDDHGMPGLNCSTCHQSENNDYSGVPGAPHWGLAPRSMAWEGLSRTEIARSMLNLENNGGRSLEEIVKHLTEDELVLWAFNPGVDNEGIPREKPPVSEEAYIAAVKAWAEAGAVIPAE